MLILGFKGLNALLLLIIGDNFKAAKVKLLSENDLLESASLWIKSELQIDANRGLAQPCFEQPGPGVGFTDNSQKCNSLFIDSNSTVTHMWKLHCFRGYKIIVSVVCFFPHLLLLNHTS